MSVNAQKYEHGFISDIVRQNHIKINEIYIPSHKIIFNYHDTLNVFFSDSPRNYVLNSLKITWTDKFLEEMKTNEDYRKMYDKDIKKYKLPTPTELHDIELPLDFVKMLVTLANMNNELDQLKSKLTVSSKSYLK